MSAPSVMSFTIRSSGLRCQPYVACVDRGSYVLRNFFVPSDRGSVASDKIRVFCEFQEPHKLQRNSHEASDHAVEAARFLADLGDRESIARGQGQPISKGRLPTFLAPTSVAPATPSPTVPPAHPGQPHVADSPDDATWARMFQEEEENMAAPDTAAEQHDTFRGEASEVYKARAEAMGLVGEVCAEKWKEMYRAH